MKSDYTNFTVIFDNGGGTTLQTATYCHYYDNPRSAAADVMAILEGDDPRGWDGNRPECRREYDWSTERSGGYKWLSRDELLYRDEGVEDWGDNSQTFFGAFDRKAVDAAMFRRCRKILGWTQKECADRLSRSVRVIQKWEAGDTSPKETLHLMKVLAGVVSVDDLRVDLFLT